MGGIYSRTRMIVSAQYVYLYISLHISMPHSVPLDHTSRCLIVQNNNHCGSPWAIRNSGVSDIRLYRLARTLAEVNN